MSTPDLNPTPILTLIPNLNPPVLNLCAFASLRKMLAFRLCLSFLVCVFCIGRIPPIYAQDPAVQNLIRNGDFTQGADEKGWPRYWACAGDATVDQTLSLDHDPEHGPCARLVCRSITGSGAASHSMLDQVNTVEIKAGQWYQVSFWARQEGIQGGALSMSIAETRTWQQTGIQEGFRAGRQWKHFQFQCRAEKSVPAENTRFQIWHHSPGTLWLADVRFLPSAGPQISYWPEIAVEGRKNLLPNSSFECGKAGWGGISQLSGWAGNLNQLVGELDRDTAVHGRQSLKIVLNEKTLPVFYFDYFDLQRETVRMPLAASRGWIPLEKGTDYTLSAYLKADHPGAPAVLAVYFDDQPLMKEISLTGEWQRYSFTFRPRGSHCFVALGPDLRHSSLPTAAVWIDSVQLEKGSAPTNYSPADPVEAGIQEDSHVFSQGQPVALTANAYNNTNTTAQIHLSTRLQDFFDAPAGEIQTDLSVPPRSSAAVILKPRLAKKGFYRAILRSQAVGRQRETELRLAVINPYKEKDSFWGMNHVYPWDSLVKGVKQAGLLWMRDWSLKWQFVEPQKGQFTFADTDPLINRPLTLGEKMLLLLPFPSSNWASTAPEAGAPASGYPAIRERMAYMPRDLGEWQSYVAACVNHYKDRTHFWEILNEPLYTDYSLPQGKGYTGKDYLTLLKAAYKAAHQADPHSFVIGGIAASGGKLYQDIIDAGALDYMDALNIHTYPGLSPPEVTEGWLETLEKWMQAAGKIKPIWLTEYGYYAEDRPSLQPLKFEMPVVESEKLCAAYYVRLHTIMLAHHVTRLFFHAGVSSRLNHEGLEGIFFDYGGGPRKVYPVQSAMSNLFPPTTQFLRKVSAPAGLRAYLFRNSTGPLLVAWAEEGYGGEIRLLDPKLHAIDIQGNPIEGKRFVLNEYPIYVQGRGLGVAEIQNSIRLASH